jgi:hypothetical protein
MHDFSADDRFVSVHSVQVHPHSHTANVTVDTRADDDDGGNDDSAMMQSKCIGRMDTRADDSYNDRDDMMAVVVLVPAVVVMLSTERPSMHRYDDDR